MRDWIGTGVSVMGLVVLVIALIVTVRARRRGGPAPHPRHRMLAFLGGLALVQAGQLLRPLTTPRIVLHALVLTLVAGAAFLQLRADRRP